MLSSHQNISSMSTILINLYTSYLPHANLPEVNVLSDWDESFADGSTLTPGTSLLSVTYSNAILLLLMEIPDTEETVSVPVFFWLTDFLCTDALVLVI